MVAPPRGERGLKPLRGLAVLHGLGRSPSWGAWIETFTPLKNRLLAIVAPPRGERGLKHAVAATYMRVVFVAPPRGERGLKLENDNAFDFESVSLPLVGSVD